MRNTSQNENRYNRIFHVVNDQKAAPDKAFLDQLRERTADEFEAAAGRNRPLETAKILRFWRTIMNSNAVKIAAAAVIICAVFIGFSPFGDRFTTTSVAWSQVIEEMQNHTRYKCRQRVIRDDGRDFPEMTIYHRDLQVRRQELPDGTIHIIDMTQKDAIQLELFPDEKRAVLTRLVGFGPKKNPDIIEMVKKFDQKSTERLGTRKQDGQVQHGFRHKPNEHNEFTVWVDSDTRLPVEVQIRHIKAGQTIILDQFEFSFELDPGAFSTEIPEGYDVQTIIQDYRPVEEKEISQQEIAEQLNHTAYRIELLPWFEKMVTLQIVNPLSKAGKNFIFAITANDGARIVISQSDMFHDYKESFLEWMLKEELKAQTSSGIKLYNHPNGKSYAKLYIQAAQKTLPEFQREEELMENAFGGMIYMPDTTILGFVADRELEEEKVLELLEALQPMEAVQ